MIASLPSRGFGAAALAVGLLLAGCSSDTDVPPTTVSAPGGGTQMNTDTGSGGNFPDINTVPNQRPTSTIQDLAQAPDGLAAAQGGTQYGEALVGGPSSSAEPPAPPPPPQPPQEALPAIPEPGIQTQTSDAQPEPVQAEPAPTVADSSEPIATPEIVEPQPMEPVAAAEPEPAPSSAGQGQTIQGTTAEPAPANPAVSDAPDAVQPEAAEVTKPEVPETAQPEPMPAAPQEPVAPVAAPQPQPQPQPQPSQPEGEVAAAPAEVQAPSPGAPQQSQLPASTSGSNDPAAYGIAVPQPAPPPSNNGTPAVAAAAPAMAPGAAGYGQPSSGGQPVGMIYFRDGSSSLSSDDLEVLRQIAEMQRANGGVINVVGHASMGASSADYASREKANQRISEARANAVAQELIGYGVPQSAIRVSAAGASQPLYSEAMPNGAAGNRRAEVYLTAY